MVLDESENYQVAGGKTMEDFARSMNLAMPMVQSAFGEMSELGATWDFQMKVFRLWVILPLLPLKPQKHCVMYL